MADIAVKSAPADAAPPLWPVVTVLGATQIVGYGTLYYAYAILAPAVAREFNVAGSLLFLVLSVGLLIGGLAAPWLGRAMDIHGAPRLMTLGSALVGGLLVWLAVAPNFATFAAIVILIEVVSIAVLYDAAFVCLALFAGTQARRAITYLTLIAGFASTLFWPLTGWLVAALGWRGTYAVFAAMQGCIALPLHLLLAAWARRIPPAKPADPDRPAGIAEAHVSGREGRIAFWAVAVSFAFSGILTSALSVHLVPVLQALGLGTQSFVASMLMGPAQVLVRLTDALFWRGLHPLVVALIGGAALPLSVVVLAGGPPVLAIGALFAILFGIGQGLESIVRGTVPLILFGREGYAERLGQLSAIRIALGAGAPFVFAAAQAAIGLRATLLALIAIGVAAVVPLVVVHRWLAARGRLGHLPH